MQEEEEGKLEISLVLVYKQCVIHPLSMDGFETLVMNFLIRAYEAVVSLINLKSLEFFVM